MTVISTTKDPESLTLTLVAEFDSAPERVWTVWEDPRKLEQWWGPPTWPATFTRHDFVVGGESRGRALDFVLQRREIALCRLRRIGAMLERIEPRAE